MVVSAGARGAYAVTREMWNYRPAPNVQAVSTAGAGDALLGGIIAAMAAGAPLLKAPEPGHALPGAALETALDLGVLLASYKCQSPHTIHPDARLRTLIDFARSRNLSFAPSLQSQFSQAPPREPNV
jgi:sugar/nucleoside kinase (ribokinase family)